MNFELNEVQEMLRSSAARFLVDCDTLEARRSSDGGSFAAGLWRSIGELGWTGIEAPEEYGGFGGDIEDMLVLLTELGSGQSAAMMIGNVVIPSYLLRRCGGDTGLSLLARLIAGESIIAFAGYEADRRYDPLARTTCVTRSDAGFVLNGAKSDAITSIRPDCLLVSAAFGDEAALFAVPTDLPGVALDTVHLIDGTLAIGARFESVKLDQAHRIAVGPAVNDWVEGALDTATLCLCAAMTGCMRRALELTTGYLKTRRQFGKQLADFQVLQHRVADMFIASNDAQSILLRAIASSREGTAERQRGISAAKLKVMSAARWVTGEAIHLHGAIGFTEEYQVGHLFKKAVVAERLFGDLDYHIERYMKLSERTAAPERSLQPVMSTAG